MTTILAGDIGGTNTTLRLVKLHDTGKEFETLFQASYLSQNFPDLGVMILQFLNTISQSPPELACLAIAGPVIEQRARLTNLNWVIDRTELEKRLKIPKVSLINDFVGVGYGLSHLSHNDLLILQGGEVRNNAPIGIIGAGTGLGEGFVIPSPQGNQVFATEGGHSDFAPRNDLEFQLLKYLKYFYNVDRVSVERVVSGQGVVGIYRFLKDQSFAYECAEMREIMTHWENSRSNYENRIDPASMIAKLALERNDPLCEKTMEIFIGAYGAETGNFALKLLPYGGFYIAGGIASKILPLIQHHLFLSSFLDKGRMRSILEKIPLKVILNPHVGVLGSISYAMTMNH